MTMEHLHLEGSKGHNKARLPGFFYEPWLVRELEKERWSSPFIPAVETDETAEAYFVHLRLHDIHKEDCSVEIRWPHLSVSIQQREERKPAFGFVKARPVLHVFARQFRLPEDVAINDIVFTCSQDGVVIKIPRR